jgi:hypothetical protein
MAVLLAAGVWPRGALAVTDDDVRKAIDRAKEFLINTQLADGTWPEVQYGQADLACGHTEMALYTLAVIGEHPNHEVMAKAIDAVLARKTTFNYAIAFRTLALAHLQNKFSPARRELIRAALKSDVQALCEAQGTLGGWTYMKATSNSRTAPIYDFSNTQLVILALREAALAGIEIPNATWQRAQDLFYKQQKPDGGWSYSENTTGQGVPTTSYGSMTAVGLASIYITSDNLEPARGCPCRMGASSKVSGEVDRRMDDALGWLEKNFNPIGNPLRPDMNNILFPYWLYAVERVGASAGYKYFGNHNWFKEGAEILVKYQSPNGAWGGRIPETCFSTLFLFKGRAPVLFNKLQFKGEWNAHRRDIASLTGYFERVKEQPFHWQIVGLQGPVEELHDAPILYVSAESVPTFTDVDKEKLKHFTDTGGTILFEASCGSPKVRVWLTTLAKSLWPDWPLKALPADHPIYADPYTLKVHPDLWGANDGIRTFLLFAHDDISCSWNVKAFAGKEHLFQLGVNIEAYATDHSPLRAKLEPWEPAKSDRYVIAPTHGPKDAVRLTRIKYEGGWNVNRNYRPFERLAKTLLEKAKITLKPEEDGAAPSALGDTDAAYLVGAGEVAFADAEKQALKDYLAKGGWLWAEAAQGATVFDKSFQTLAAEQAWELKLLPADHPLMNGKFKTAAGYNVAKGVQFRRALKMRRTNSPFVDFFGIYQDGKLVGVYSPLDLMFSTTGYESYGCLGYQTPDAVAAATNMVVFLTDRAADK